MKHLVLGLGRYSTAALQQLNQLRMQHEQTIASTELLWIDNSALSQPNRLDAVTLPQDQTIRLTAFDADRVHQFVVTRAQNQSSTPTHELAAHQQTDTRRWTRTCTCSPRPWNSPTRPPPAWAGRPAPHTAPSRSRARLRIWLRASA